MVLEGTRRLCHGPRRTMEGYVVSARHDLGRVSAAIMPIAGKLARNKALVAVRDGIVYAMPLLIIGSLFMVVASFPVPGWEEYLGSVGVADYLWKGVNSSFGLLGLAASFGIAYSLTKQYKVEAVPAGIISMSAFIVVTPFIADAEGSEGLPTAAMSAQGLFVAIVLGLVNGWVYQWFIGHNIEIRMPDGVPPAVARSFSGIIPGAVIITTWLIVFSLLEALHWPDVHAIVQTVVGNPLGALGSNIGGVVVLVLLNSALWFIGIHGGSVVDSVMKPVWISNLDENASAYQQGLDLPHIITLPFMENFVYLGGSGAAIGLVLALFWASRRRKASQRAKALGPLAVVPGLFNINEPAMFGVPVVLNVLLAAPFVAAPLVNLVLTWSAMSIGLVPLTYASPGWTMPPVLSGVLATGSVSASMLQVLLVVIDVALYLPFVIMMERNFRRSEGILATGDREGEESNR